jgi:peptidoglycan/xylan/chitin deacetylase (PgdA/CDA1 family)
MIPMISITVDCELCDIERLRGRHNSVGVHKSIEGNRKLMALFEKYGIRTTFFINGQFAERARANVIRISKKHEIASHGYEHLYYKNPKINIPEDIRRSKELLEKMTGQRIFGFRAPQGRLTKNDIGMLEQLGFTYDSSLQTGITNKNFGRNMVPNRIFRIGNVMEIPPSAVPGIRFPMSWAAVRNLPLLYSKAATSLLLWRQNPVVIYVHSWEFSDVSRAKAPAYLKRNCGNKFLEKLGRYIRYFSCRGARFVPMEEILRFSLQKA